MLNATSEQQAVQELLYLKAVAKLNSEDLIGAHQTVSQLLNVSIQYSPLQIGRTLNL